jgi:hypothetical protein
VVGVVKRRNASLLKKGLSENLLRKGFIANFLEKSLIKNHALTKTAWSNDATFAAQWFRRAVC